MIKLFQPYISKKSIENVIRVLSSTQLAEGPEVKAFEKEFAEKFGFEPWQIVSLNSGTSALELAYELSLVNQFSFVFSPILTCTATNIPLIRKKTVLRFVDIDGRKTLNIDPRDLENKIKEVKNFYRKVVVFVHFGGSSEGLEAVEEICQMGRMDLICDAAQALGSNLSKKARFNCISLQAIKSLTAGDGGILICRDPEDAEKARKLRWFGYDRELKHKLGDTDLDLAGYKYHMNDISAAIARGNLAEWDKIYSHRKKINDIYRKYGEGKGFIEGIWNPQVVGYNFLEIKEKMEKEGIEIGQYHYRNDKYSIFPEAECPRMNEIEEIYFMLPCHMGMTEEDAERIAKIIWPQI